VDYPFDVLELEGVDGTGKTSVLDLIRKTVSSTTQFAFLPSSPYREIVFNPPGGKVMPSPVAVMAFGVNRWHELEVFRQKKTKKNGLQFNKLIFDRYLWSTFVYQPDVDEAFINDLHVVCGLPYPKKAILLTASLEALKWRLENRGGPQDIYDRIDLINERQKRYIETAKRLKYPAEIIDTTYMTPAEVAEDVKKIFELK
jgi:thymidylate kinase